ncbi:calcium-binding protein [Streptomyces adustus]|uniref:Calcium-binding protein n=1 Tax=Streptomyces adustus TaxID=1609272 RepID=A0A5N8VT79_9ACTN|nr:DUF5707 domain-containing protein [Streptomyces adustus]MPY37248.1 calcium-binding protein [Streptomyces adustus]
MRIPATVAAVSGALALTGLAVPAASAADELPKVSKVSVNSGADIVVGPSAAKKFTVSVTASHSSGIQDIDVTLWHGTGREIGLDGLLLANEGRATCTAASATTSTCKLTVTAAPGSNLTANVQAGTWHVELGVFARDGRVYWNDYQTTHRVQRASTLTVNATPEPVKKGKTITVTGKLARANWETFKYAGYAAQPVKLQFKKKGATAYTTLKTIKTNSTGVLSTTVKASADGYFRYVFAGTSTTPAVSAAGDFIDVR